MSAKRVFSEFRNTHTERLSTEEFIQRCKVSNPRGSPGISSTVSDTWQEKKHETSFILEQPAVKTFIKLLSEIATRCQSLEDRVKDLQSQVSNLETTVQDLCKASSTDTESTSSKFPDQSNATSEEEDLSSTTEDLKERLQQLQWKTFDLNRQNELLRRMLEIQCTVNRNAAASTTAANEKKKDTETNNNGNSSIQQADTTSNTQSSTNLCTQQHMPPPGPDEEYVPLSAEEMLSLSFADPKVPWSANDGTDVVMDKSNKDCSQGSKIGEPEVKCAYVYAPCPKSTEGIWGTPHKQNLYVWERRKDDEKGN